MKKNRLFITILLLMFMIIFVGCGSKEDNYNDEKPKIEEVVIIDQGESNFDFLCAKNANTETIYAMKTLLNKIEEKTGKKYTAYRDTFEREEGSYEVLIGLTSRQESIDEYNKLPKYGYSCTIKNGCIVILGTSDIFLSMALYKFEENILNNKEYCDTGLLRVTSDKCFNVDFGKEVSVKDIIDMGKTPIASIEEFFKVQAEGVLRVAQGACTDGEYMYFVLRDTDDTKAIIKVYDMDGNFVRQSDEIYLGHGNDLTYCDKDGYIYCAQGVKESNTYAKIDRKTLTVLNRTDVNSVGGGGSITYNKDLDLFATSKGGETLSFYKQDFEYIKTLKREVINYTAQGVGSDEEYIYFPMSGSTDNVLAMYDWNGNFVTNITVPTKAESESMFYSNGKYYLFFYIPGVGGSLFNMSFTFRYE